MAEDGTRVLHDGKWLRMIAIPTTDREGKPAGEWEAVERTTSLPGMVDGVDVLARMKSGADDEERLLLVSVFRPPVGKYSLELPAGLVDEGEEAATAAMRELKEETGYVAAAAALMPSEEGKAAEGESAVGVCSSVLHCDPWKSRESFRIVGATVDMADERNAEPEQELEVSEAITAFSLAIRPGILAELEAYAKEKDAVIDGKLYMLLLGLELGWRTSGKAPAAKKEAEGEEAGSAAAE